MSVWKVSGTIVDAGDPPRCRILNPGGLAVGTNVYGLAIDGRGFLWTASTPTVKVNVATVSIVDTVSHPSYYGIAIDKQNRVWFGGWSGAGTMHRIDGDPPYALLNSTVYGVTAVTVHPNGTVWGSIYGTATYPTGAVKLTLDAAGANIVNTQNFVDPNGLENHGIAVDRAGKVWSSQRFGGKANRWQESGVHDGLFDVDPSRELYTYSDFTGIQLRTITIHEGHWIQDYDSGYQHAIWDHAEWTAIIPAGTSVTVQARAADNQADFAAGLATAWCGPFTVSPAVFHPACAFLDDHRWLQLDVKLNTTVDGVRPSVSDVKVFWSY